MTASLNAVTVFFEENIREDDAESLVNALRWMKGVASVEPHVASAVDEHAGAMRERRRVGEAIFDIVYPKPDIPPR